MQYKRNKITTFILDKKWSVIRHLLLIVPLTTTLYPDITPESRRFLNIISSQDISVVTNGFYKLSFVMFVSALSILYVNFFFAVPKLLFKNKYIYYALSLLGMAAVYFLIEKYSMETIFKGYEKFVTIPQFSFKSVIDNTLNPIVFLGATTGYKIFKKWVMDIERLTEMENAQLQMELNQLKNQVNPHFLFNTLNNLDTLVKTDTEKASQVIHGLSDVIRYQIYDSNKEKILLSKDIEILKQLLMLEKIRRDKFDYEISVTGDIDGLLVPPLLFINFIDNSLKHSLDNRNNSFIKIKWNYDRKDLIFFIQNSKPSFLQKRENGGLGLKNIKRRLELLFDTRFSLNIDDEEKMYTVILKIEL